MTQRQIGAVHLLHAFDVGEAKGRALRLGLDFECFDIHVPTQRRATFPFIPLCFQQAPFVRSCDGERCHIRTNGAFVMRRHEPCAMRHQKRSGLWHSNGAFDHCASLDWLRDGDLPRFFLR